MFKKSYILLAIIFLLFAYPLNIFSQKTHNKKNKTVKKKSPIHSSGVAYEDPSSGSEIALAKLKRINAFNQVWETINDYYFDKNFNGLDWNAVRREMIPKVRLANNDEELHVLLQEMINRLNSSHFSIIPPDTYQEIENAKFESRKKENERKSKIAGIVKDKSVDFEDESEDFFDDDYDRYGVPFKFKIIDSQAVITKVEKDSNAEKAGLKQGYVLDKINGILLKDLIYRIQFSKTYSKSYKNQIPLILSFLLSGELDSEVEITFSDDNNSQKTVLLKREGLKGELVKILDNAPPSFLSFEKKSINDKTGYISFNVFALPALYKFCEALTEFKKKENLVIDLRDNLGGSFVVLIGMIGMLNDKSSSIGTQIKRNTIEPMVVAPKPKNFKGKIVVLVDAQSVSAAEIFAAALQENNRAVIIGERSAGEVLPALTKRLNTGAVFLYPIANFKTPKGNFLEGKGVEPNILVTYEKKKLLEAKDAHLDKALAYFENEIKIESNKKSEESYDEPPPVSIKSPPPTPKPITSPQGSNLSVNINPQTSEPVENKQDEKALKIISDYIYAIGGSENIRKINSYTAKGTAELNTSGTVMYGNVEINHKSPNKISEVTFFDNLGEIRQVFDGKSFLIQSIAGGDVEFSFSSYTSEYKLLADFREILNIRENYPKITYIGLFDREGRETHLVEAVTKENIKVVFAFDAKTKFLVSRASRTLTNSYSDYRKVGDLMFPFQQSGSIIFTFKFSDVKFDTQIDDSSFVKKEYCYNTVN